LFLLQEEIKEKQEKQRESTSKGPGWGA